MYTKKRDLIEITTSNLHKMTKREVRDVATEAQKENLMNRISPTAKKKEIVAIILQSLEEKRRKSSLNKVSKEKRSKKRKKSWLQKYALLSAIMVGVVGSNIVPVKARFIDEEEERFNKELKPHGRKMYKVAGDGNCQFRALSHQLLGSVERHMEVRQNVCIRLRDEWNRYCGTDVLTGEEFALWNYDHNEYKAWVARMQRDGEWGNHLTLQAAADLYRKRIKLVPIVERLVEGVTTYEERPIITIDPNTFHEGNMLWLTFKPELHYNSTVPIHTRLAEAKRLAEAERLADGTSEPFLAGARVLYEGNSPGVVRVMHHDLNKTPGGIYYTVDLDDGRVVTALPKSIRA